MIQALIFDFDGLILDTEMPEYLSWQELYASFEHEMPLAKWAAEVGTFGVFDPYDYLEELLGRPRDRSAARATRHARFAELIADEAILPGVEAYLLEAKTRGLKLGVASSSPRSWVAGHLERLGLIDLFDCIKTSDDVEHVKPDPALYLAALSTLGVAAHAALALEDSPNGALAAMRAGIYCVVVPNRLTSQFVFDSVEMQLQSMADLPLGELLARVAAHRAAPAVS
jgi:HAD superfamily hydrolase (TIGR01509 family)